MEKGKAVQHLSIDRYVPVRNNVLMKGKISFDIIFIENRANEETGPRNEYLPR